MNLPVPHPIDCVQQPTEREPAGDWARTTSSQLAGTAHKRSIHILQQQDAPVNVWCTKTTTILLPCVCMGAPARSG